MCNWLEYSLRDAAARLAMPCHVFVFAAGDAGEEIALVGLRWKNPPIAVWQHIYKN